LFFFRSLFSDGVLSSGSLHLTEVPIFAAGLGPQDFFLSFFFPLSATCLFLVIRLGRPAPLRVSLAVTPFAHVSSALFGIWALPLTSFYSLFLTSCHKRPRLPRGDARFSRASSVCRKRDTGRQDSPIIVQVRTNQLPPFVVLRRKRSSTASRGDPPLIGEDLDEVFGERRQGFFCRKIPKGRRRERSLFRG